MKKIMDYLKMVCNLLFSQSRNNHLSSLPTRQNRKKTNRLKKVSNEKELVWKVEDFMEARYEFRYNRLTTVNEYRQKNADNTPFIPIDQREMNTVCIDARKSGINCWDRDISRYINSSHVISYHPLETFIRELPPWDGIERVKNIACRVSNEPLWIKSFHQWLLALTAQWMGMDQYYGNSVAPVLVSTRQGKHKSTFCKMLLPDILQPYYTDSFDLSSIAGAEHKLTSFGLINLDEMDKFSPKKMALLKNLMQMAGVNLRKAYQKNYSSLPRIASFIGTSNQMELLTDPTGSRRFFCVEVKKKIDCSLIDHPQLYAQLKTELLQGTRYWFTEEEEATIMENNARFQKTGMEQDAFYGCFRPVEKEEKGCLLSAAQIFSQLKKKYPAAMREVSPHHFGKVLTQIGLERIHTRQGNMYKVIPIG